MKLGKSLLTAFVLMVSMVLIVACGSNENSTKNNSNSNDNDNNSGTVESSWAEENGVFETESVDELYEKAKEEGKVVIYSNGSKFKDVKVSFEAEYPGITVEPFKISRAELKEKLTREHEAGVYNVDVVHTNAEPDLLDGGYVFPFRPDDIMETYFDDFKDAEYPSHYMTVNPIIYNTEVYDEPPVTNWWDLTEPEWKGKVLLNDPVSDITYSELFVTIIQNSDEMEEAYKDKYGEEIELTEENAGYEFISRFIANDPILMSSGEDIIEGVGQSGQTDPPIGFTSSSKLRHIEQSGLPIDGTFDLNPKVSVISSKTLYVANQASHPNAAKLLIRWAMGEADGQAAGLDPFNLYGVWVPRENTENHNELSVEDISAWEFDQKYYDENFPVFRNYWISKID